MARVDVETDRVCPSEVKGGGETAGGKIKTSHQDHSENCEKCGFMIMKPPAPLPPSLSLAQKTNPGSYFSFVYHNILSSKSFLHTQFPIPPIYRLFSPYASPLLYHSHPPYLPSLPPPPSSPHLIPTLLIFLMDSPQSLPCLLFHLLLSSCKRILPVPSNLHT